MKRVKLLFFTTLAVLIYAEAQAQNSFFPTKAGTELLFADNDAKGKPQSYSKQTIKTVEGSGDNMSISYVIESLDKNKKPLDPPVEIPCKVTIKDGVVIFDMKSAFAGMMNQQLKMELTGVPMELPANLQPGQSLKDANMTLTIDMGVMKMKTEMKMTDSKCLAIEDVKVGAGAFKCHKVTQTVSTTALKTTTVNQTVSWFAPGVGAIKTETFDSKNKLISSTELVSIKN